MGFIVRILDGITARLGGENTKENVGRFSDVALIVLLIGILMMMIVPISPHIIDFMIAGNLTVSITLLMVAMYIPGATHLSIFPSLLLITTLYRLGLNIASTKQILAPRLCRGYYFCIRQLRCRRKLRRRRRDLSDHYPGAVYRDR